MSLRVNTEDKRTFTLPKLTLEKRFSLVADFLSDNPEAEEIDLDMTSQTFLNITSLFDYGNIPDLSMSEMTRFLYGIDYLAPSPRFNSLIEQVVREAFDKFNLSYFPGISFRDYAKKLEDPGYYSEEEKKYLKNVKRNQGINNVMVGYMYGDVGTPGPIGPTGIVGATGPRGIVGTTDLRVILGATGSRAMIG